MRDYSLELNAEKIHSAKTKNYFKEVLNSYNSDSFRSSIVMLYSIVIADLIYKLEDLNDLYSDESAKRILDEIAEMQAKKPNSPDWETKLIECIKEQTKLLDPGDYQNIISLQKHRHLCAHPIITQDYELYSPNKETARAHIRNCLDGILTKPPLLSKKVINVFLKDLARVQDIILKPNELEAYITAKYLKNLPDRVEASLFRSLWRIILKLEDDDCTENRSINLQALIIILMRNPKQRLEDIKKEADYFSDLNPKFIFEIIEVLNYRPDIYSHLSDGARVLLENKIERNADLTIAAFFRSNDVTDHIDKSLALEVWDETQFDDGRISMGVVQNIADIAQRLGQNQEAHRLLIGMFANSYNYDMADIRFNHLIAPYLDEFDGQALEQLVASFDDNSQIYHRYQAKNTGKMIKRRVDEAFEDKFDYTPFPNFRRTLNMK
jgi:hypothetical protein